MPKYQNILFVSTGVADETEALKQALSLARNHAAQLTVMVVHPAFPAHLAAYEEKYEQNLQNEMQATLQQVAQDVDADLEAMAPTVVTEQKSKPAIAIIKYALKHAVDLVVKQAETKESGQGFKALDMALLRKCPCPVWLCRPIAHHREDIKIAVAVEADSEREEGRDLSLQLLKTADMLAQDCGQTLEVVSCWSYELEASLRDSRWLAVPPEELEEQVEAARTHSLTALEDLMDQAELTAAASVHHLKGAPDTLIPQFIEEHGIDVLVMGTVARTGLPGFVIGNTAENVLQKVGCSLVALKPHGFVSPVVAY